MFGLWTLSGLWFVLQSGGRENAGYIVLPLAAVLALGLIGREMKEQIG